MHLVVFSCKYNYCCWWNIDYSDIIFDAVDK